jgi:hypothetical protein
MKIILWILITAGIIILVILVAGLFTKKKYTVEREITINRPKNQVFSYLRLLRNQDNFSKWAKMDPAMKQEFKGTDGTVGFVSAWDSEIKNVGKGEQEIVKISEGEKIDFEIRFIKPFEGEANAYMSVDSVSAAQTKVKWGFIGKMNYPMNLMLVFMNMEKMVGNDLDVGLGNLKTLLEKQSQ